MPEAPASSSPCSACAAPLAHDQRYCLECGERRGPLPPEPAALIGTMRERGGPAVAAAAPPPAADEPGRNWIPSPRAAAAAVLAMLTFGMFIGSVTGPGLASTLSTPERIIVSLGSSRSVNETANSAGSGASSVTSSSTQTATTITQTITEPAPAAPAGSPAPAAQPSSPAPGLTPTSSGPLPPARHVFLVVLSDQGYSQTFGSTDPYFSRALPKQGGLVPNYFGVTAGELANEIALISGQGPTPQTAADCPQFADLAPTGTGALSQVLGAGCVYPKRTQTLADELAAGRHGGWRAYVEGIDAGAKGQPTTCRHPAIGAADANAVSSPTDPYVTWRNPFVYFHSLIDGTSCAEHDVSLTRLAVDLKTASTTPALSYIAPGPCDDGSPEPCRAGAPAGLAPAATFLKTVLAEIERSPAYKADGLILVTFDQAPQTGPHADANGCCTTHPFPNLPTATTTATTSESTTTSSTTTTTSSDTTSDSGLPATPTGGGQVGLLAISRWVKPGSTDFVDSYNHFSLLGTIEKMLGVARLGYAADPSMPLFGPAVFNGYSG